jgi:uncharacterized protein YbjT (DUF2867 family)
MQKILVIGSTGNVGSTLTQQLIASGETVRAATRNPAAYPATAGVEPVPFDYADPSTFEPALEGTDRVFLLEPQPPLNMAPGEFMIPFIEAAARGGRKIVLMSSASVVFDEDEPLLKVEHALKQTHARYVILRPNWFMDNFHTLWLAPILQAGIIPVPAADSLTAFIDARDIAAAAAAALRDDHQNGQTFTLTGPQALTYSQVASAISAAAGRPVQYVPVDDHSFTQSLLEAGLPREHALYITKLFQHTRTGAALELTASVQQLTARPPHTFEQYANDNAPAWAKPVVGPLT